MWVLALGLFSEMEVLHSVNETQIISISNSEERAAIIIFMS